MTQLTTIEFYLRQAILDVIDSQRWEMWGQPAPHFCVSEDHANEQRLDFADAVLKRRRELTPKVGEPVSCPVEDPSCEGGDDQSHDACDEAHPDYQRYNSGVFKDYNCSECGKRLGTQDLSETVCRLCRPPAFNNAFNNPDFHHSTEGFLTPPSVYRPSYKPELLVGVWDNTEACPLPTARADHLNAAGKWDAVQILAETCGDVWPKHRLECSLCQRKIREAEHATGVASDATKRSYPNLTAFNATAAAILAYTLDKPAEAAKNHRRAAAAYSDLDVALQGLIEKGLITEVIE